MIIFLSYGFCNTNNYSPENHNFLANWRRLNLRVAFCLLESVGCMINSSLNTRSKIALAHWRTAAAAVFTVEGDFER